MNEEKETFEKFINLCETSDYIMVNGHLGTYVKECGEIVFPRNGMCLPNIKVSNFEIHKLYGDKWVLVPDGEFSYFYRVRFLNEVKN